MAGAMVWGCALGVSAAEPALPKVEARRGPQASWSFFPTRTLTQLKGFSPVLPADGYGAYGGLPVLKQPATGFCHVKKIGDRWWLVGPDGQVFLHVAVVSVKPGASPGSQESLKKVFESEPVWASRTCELLRDHGFNGTGAWSSDELIRRTSKPLFYTPILNWMSGYGAKRGGTYQKPGQTGYPNDCAFIFDPEFEAYCERNAQQLAKNRDDPYLLGYFSDNEMPFAFDALDRYLALDANDPGRAAAEQWLLKRRSAAGAKITSKDRQDFVEFLVGTYMRIVSTAIKKHDPNHLYLGCRFHGRDLDSKELFKGAGPYADAISVNWYGEWTPPLWKLRNWEKWSGKPVIITEWYVKGEDSGMPNTGGAGWIVRSQKDRGMFYQNFVLPLIESKVCVGWHWFKYQDNDPEDTRADPSNRDSNKGIVSNRYVEYKPLLDAMKELNQQLYPLIEYFDGREKK
jgi:hypothetical protein